MSNKKMLLKKKFVVFSFLFLAISCSHPKPSQVSNIGDFLQKVLAKNPSFESLRARSSVVVRSDRSYRFGVDFLMTDQAFYLETKVLGLVRATGSLWNNQLSFYVPSERKLFVGTEESSLENLIHVPLYPNALFQPILKKYQRSDFVEADIEIEDSHYVVKTLNQTTYWVDPTFWISKVVLPNGLVVKYGPSKRGTSYPSSVELQIHSQSIKLEIKDVQTNPELGDELFRMNIRGSDYDIVNLP